MRNNACTSCRERKVKCDNLQPCSYCNIRALDCQYPDSKQQRRKHVARHREQFQQDTRQQSQNHTPDDNGLSFGLDGRHQGQNPATLKQSPRVAGADQVRSSFGYVDTHQGHTFSPGTDGTDNPSSVLAFAPNLHTGRYVEGLLEKILGEPGPSDFPDPGSSTAQLDEETRYTGPSSGLSVLSTKILLCVSKQMRECTSFDFLKELESCQTCLQKIQQRVQQLPERSMYFPSLLTAPLPSEDVASVYVDEYFNTCQVIFPIVQRKSFELAWKENLEHPEIFDISFYALQNAILAMGAITNKSASTPSSYRAAKEEAMAYFNNALDIQSSLLRTRTNIMAVQTFCVLAMLASIIGDYEAGYMCTTLATQLAQSKGLHKRASGSSSISRAHQSERERVFWIVYFFDKMNSLNTGRPSHIDDRDISCSFPKPDEIDSQNFSPGSGEVLLHMVKFTHICSKIQTRLYSATALNTTISQLFQVRESLCHDLSTWRDQIPAQYHTKKTPFRVSSLPPHAKPVRAVLLRIAYHHALCAIHRRFSSLFAQRPREETEVESQEFQHSDSGLSTAARELILLLDQVEMDVDAPNWFFAYQLLAAVIPLFIFVVTNPLDASATEDIALMNVATGIFGRLEFITAGDFAFDGVTQLAPQATSIVEQAKKHLWDTRGVDMNTADAFSLENFSQLQNTGSISTLSDHYIAGELDNILGFSGVPFS